MDATVKQIERSVLLFLSSSESILFRCADAGIDIVRVTVQGIKEAHATSDNDGCYPIVLMMFFRVD